MLRYLSLRDFVIVDLLELDLQAGFSALTGETGAGKSILIDALSLVLGGRADALVVRQGAKKAEISAAFDLARQAPVRDWLEANALGENENANENTNQNASGDPNGDCLLRRVIDDSGRSRAFINGRAVTLTQMRELGEQLIDIHGQHEHQRLLRREAQRELIDDYAGAQTQLKQVLERYREWQRLHELRAAREENAAASTREREELTWQIQELTALGFTPEGWEELQAEHNRLANAAALIETVQACLDTLDESEAAALAQVDSAVARLERGAEVDTALIPAREMAQSASVNLREALHHLRHYLSKLELDPARLAEADRRIAAVHEQARKLRIEPLRIPDLLQQKKDRLAALGGESSLQELRAAEAEAQAQYMTAAKKLSKLRSQAAKKFSAQVTESMQSLAMQGGRLSVELPPCEPAAHGLEQCEFLVAAHEGQPLGPLSKIASGGELSRISLAIQVLASTHAGVPTLIFDEVDAGIGGRVAEIVGRMLSSLARSQQVMCVTHLAQVAACADQQLRVTKNARAGAVVSQVEALDGTARTEEIARMLGGIHITAATRKHAEEMLQHARHAAQDDDTIREQR